VLLSPSAAAETVGGPSQKPVVDAAPPAHYFGVPAVGVRSPSALEAAVRQALAANGPTVIEAVVDSEHYLETVYD